jgi:hypothetical protein
VENVDGVIIAAVKLVTQNAMSPVLRRAPALSTYLQ